MENYRLSGDINLFDIHNAYQTVNPAYYKGISKQCDRIKFKQGVTVYVIIKLFGTIAIACCNQTPGKTVPLKRNCP